MQSKDENEGGNVCISLLLPVALFSLPKSFYYGLFMRAVKYADGRSNLIIEVKPYDKSGIVMTRSNEVDLLMLLEMTDRKDGH